MMKVENPMRFVRELKGAPLSVVVLLMMTGVGMSNGAICNGTGYSDKSVAGALSYLEEIGMVVHSSGGWRMAEGDQLALMQQMALPMVDDQEGGENLDTDGGSRRISDSIVKVVNSINTNDLSKDLTNLTTVDESENFRVEENLAVMQEVGIKRTRKTEALARAGHVDALYVLSHVEQVRREKQQLGLAIWRMDHGQVRPLLRKANGHLEGCGCSGCAYSVEGLELMDEDEEWAWFEARNKENS